MKYFFIFFLFLPIITLATNDFIPIEEDSLYFTQNNQIFFGYDEEKILIPEADIQTFQTIPYEKSHYEGWLARDKNYIYFYEKPILGIDINSVEILSGGFIKDNKNIFFSNKKLNTNIRMFTIIQPEHTYPGMYAKDDKKVFITSYNKISIIKNADPKTFEIILPQGYEMIGGFSKDKNNVYYYKTPLRELDPKTLKFEILGEGFEKTIILYDNNTLYINNNKIKTPVYFNFSSIKIIASTMTEQIIYDGKNFYTYIYNTGGNGIELKKINTEKITSPKTLQYNNNIFTDGINTYFFDIENNIFLISK